MNYDHTEKAGNRGDVWKHVILLSVLGKTLPDPSASYSISYFETHCGKNSYILSSNGAWREGIGRFSPAGTDVGKHPYFRIQDGPAGIGSVYHGSWGLAAAYLRKKGRPFRFILCDFSRDVEASVRKFETHRPEIIDFRCTDGFAELKKESRRQDLIFIDPPYSPPDSPHDWQACADISVDLSLSSTPFVIWYPLFEEENPQRLVERAASPGYEVQWKTEWGKKKMTGAGMVMGNCHSLFNRNDFTVLKLVAVHFGGRFHVRRPRT